MLDVGAERLLVSDIDRAYIAIDYNDTSGLDERQPLTRTDSKDIIYLKHYTLLKKLTLRIPAKL